MNTKYSHQFLTMGVCLFTLNQFYLLDGTLHEIKTKEIFSRHIFNFDRITKKLLKFTDSYLVTENKTDSSDNDDRTVMKLDQSYLRKENAYIVTQS